MNEDTNTPKMSTNEVQKEQNRERGQGLTAPALTSVDEGDGLRREFDCARSGESLRQVRHNLNSKHHSGTTLVDYVTLWPTPRANDFSQIRKVYGNQREAESHREATLEVAAAARPSLHQGGTTEPDVGRVADGVPRQVDRLKSLGKAVVPQVGEFVGKLIMKAEQAELHLLEA